MAVECVDGVLQLDSGDLEVDELVLEGNDGVHIVEHNSSLVKAITQSTIVHQKEGRRIKRDVEHLHTDPLESQV